MKIIIWIIIQTLEILNHLFFNGASQVATGFFFRSHALSSHRPTSDRHAPLQTRPDLETGTDGDFTVDSDY